MKAAVLNQVGDTKLELRDDVTTTDVGAREIRIRVRATGVCHSDVSAMDGTLPALAPGIIGHEGAGEVVEVGSQVTEFAPGDHAVLTFVPPCGTCVNCVGGRPHLCAIHTIAAFMNPRFLMGDTPVFGYAGTGTFAEELVVPVEGAVKIADDVPFEIAALVACGVMTGVGAVINTAKVELGSTVLVIGCGGVGVSVIQGARLAGAAQIVAVDPLVDKHETAKHFGATHAVTPDELAGAARVADREPGLGLHVRRGRRAGDDPLRVGQRAPRRHGRRGRRRARRTRWCSSARRSCSCTTSGCSARSTAVRTCAVTIHGCCRCGGPAGSTSTA